jgi:hypothetical protein
MTARRSVSGNVFMVFALASLLGAGVLSAQVTNRFTGTWSRQVHVQTWPTPEERDFAR